MAAERKIGGTVYKCEKLPASEGLPLFLRVTKFLQSAPTVTAGLASGKGDAGAAFLTICMTSDADPAETQQLLTDLAQSCTTGGDPCVVGVKPQSMEDLIAVAWFAMEVNFKSFLAASLPGMMTFLGAEADGA